MPNPIDENDPDDNSGSKHGGHRHEAELHSHSEYDASQFPHLSSLSSCAQHRLSRFFRSRGTGSESMDLSLSSSRISSFFGLVGRADDSDASLRSDGGGSRQDVKRVDFDRKQSDISNMSTDSGDNCLEDNDNHCGRRAPRIKEVRPVQISLEVPKRKVTDKVNETKA